MRPLAKRDVDNLGFAIAFIGFVFQMCMVVGYGWLSTNGNYGTNPFQIPKGTTNYSLIQATQAFLVIGCLITCLSFIFDRVNKFKDMLGDENRIHQIVALCWIVSAFCSLIALSCFTSWKGKVYKNNKIVGYGFSYGLGWVSFIFQTLAGCLFIYWGQL